MAKKTSSPNALWTLEDRVELLAWLDHSLQHGINFENTIIAHLRRLRDKEYTAQQVNEKLRTFWRYHRITAYSPRNGWKDILQHGSKIIHLSDEEEEVIGPALQRLEEENIATLFSPQRRLRSNSRFGDCHSSPYISLETLNLLEIKTKINQRHRGYTAQSGSPARLVTKREPESVETATPEAITPRKRPKKALEAVRVAALYLAQGY